MDQFSFARQPILNSSLELYAYEFLYRSPQQKKQTSHSLTAEVIASSLLDLGLEKAANNRLVFLNMSYDDLFSPHIEALPKDQIILELLEDIKPDTTLINRVKELADKGFSFALDDFVYTPDWDPLIELTKIIKLDLTVTSAEENRALIQKLKPKKITFLAEKIETHEEFKLYKAMGCELFQGYFFCTPEIIQGKSTSANSIRVTQLLSAVNQENISPEELEKIIQHDPNLINMLLRFLNSANFSFKTSIQSIKHAVVILGMAETKKWVTLISLRSSSSKPNELIRLTLVRAKLAETIAIKNKLDSSSYFLMGLLSTLDSLLDMPMGEALELMPLNEEITTALLSRQGNMGELLSTLIQHEKLSKWPEGHDYSDEYLEACYWADDAASETT